VPAVVLEADSRRSAKPQAQRGYQAQRETQAQREYQAQYETPAPRKVKRERRQQARANARAGLPALQS